MVVGLGVRVAVAAVTVVAGEHAPVRAIVAAVVAVVAREHTPVPAVVDGSGRGEEVPVSVAGVSVVVLGIVAVEAEPVVLGTGPVIVLKIRLGAG